MCVCDSACTSVRACVCVRMCVSVCDTFQAAGNTMVSNALWSSSISSVMSVSPLTALQMLSREERTAPSSRSNRLTSSFRTTSNHVTECWPPVHTRTRTRTHTYTHMHTHNVSPIQCLKCPAIPANEHIPSSFAIELISEIISCRYLVFPELWPDSTLSGSFFRM